jgi:hypothetical protein
VISRPSARSRTIPLGGRLFNGLLTSAVATTDATRQKTLYGDALS